jgi:hypothetical protein
MFIDQEQPKTAHDAGTPKWGPQAGSSFLSAHQPTVHFLGSVQCPESCPTSSLGRGSALPVCTSPSGLWPIVFNLGAASGLRVGSRIEGTLVPGVAAAHEGP